ncbi:NAD(P)H-dependent oxidoreductase [Paenibacillus sp. WLX1005]|uniref:NAD(P)H-dependent oxidoreductase n=1 Tax=Paenibacillus sp. WLX1005 TaxID=3243766 RepID=UPI003984471D
MKTLIVVAHPNLHESRINKRWLQELEQYSDRLTIHNLYEQYPDSKLDIAREQTLLEQHDRIILQFPLYWFSSPPLLKQWLDEVFLEDWAYGTDIELFHSKTISVAISAGSRESDYQMDRKYRYDIHHILSPFEVTTRYLNAQYREPFVLYAAGSHLSDDALEDSAKRYAEYALQPYADTQAVQYLH